MNSNGKNGNYTAQQFITAIPGTGGIITTIAKRVDCDWHTAKRYIDRHPTVRRAYDDERERVLDLAESGILESLRDGDLQMCKWYASMQGADRGYAPKTRREITGKDGEEIRVVIGGLSLDEDI